LKLFKCFDKYYVECPEQVIAVWAENEKKALRKVADIHKKIKMYDAPVRTVMNEWKTEEYIVPANCHVYIAYSAEMGSKDDAKFIFVPFEVQDVESYVMDRLTEEESRDPLFREFVLQKSINAGLNEYFYTDEHGWIFNSESAVLTLREDLEVKLLFEDISEGQFIDEFWLTNVSKFFEDKYYFKQFFDYITTDQEADFNEGFYAFICRKLMEQGDWVTYEDIREVN
jgi:hypothetical protein